MIHYFPKHVNTCSKCRPCIVHLKNINARLNFINYSTTTLSIHHIPIDNIIKFNVHFRSFSAIKNCVYIIGYKCLVSARAGHAVELESHITDHTCMTSSHYIMLAPGWPALINIKCLTCKECQFLCQTFLSRIWIRLAVMSTE